ncbi:MAG TPA: CorA family divalent cation transporter, partial [Candidatus Saccharimonadia bacterium]|nr:CorA family divalent cation transporter [Candidatus Saccharimonadia bacterium]
AAGADREVGLDDHPLVGLAPDEIMWVDIRAPNSADLDRLRACYDWHAETIADLGRDLGRARLRMFPSYVHLTIEAITCGHDLGAAEIDLLVGRNFVVSVHPVDLPTLASLDAEHRGDSRLGKLSAAQFMAILVDRVLGDYLACVEDIEREIDRLDDLALRAGGNELLAPIVRLRRRIGFVRRTLAPHEIAFAALARPDFELHDELGQPWPGLVDRLRQTMAATENARDLLLGTFDVLMARMGQRSNQAVQTLTVVSAMFLPAAVLAGVMGMNFQLAFFENSGGFIVVVSVMVLVALAILGVARWRGWV